MLPPFSFRPPRLPPPSLERRALVSRVPGDYFHPATNQRPFFRLGEGEQGVAIDLVAVLGLPTAVSGMFDALLVETVFSKQNSALVVRILIDNPAHRPNV